MSKILIFTNKDSLESISILVDSAKKAWGDDFASFPEDDNPIYRCDFSPEGPAKLTPETSCEKEGVYLIFDLIDETSAKALSEPCSEGEVLVLYHSHTKPDVVETFAKLANPNRLLLKGQHEETHPELFYYPIFSTLLDEEGNKFSRIRNILMPIESKMLQDAALRFFSGCMKSPSNADEGFMKDYELLLQDKELEPILKGFYENSYSQGKTTEAYLDELRGASEQILSIICDRMDEEERAKNA